MPEWAMWIAGGAIVVFCYLRLACWLGRILGERSKDYPPPPPDWDWLQQMRANADRETLQEAGLSCEREVHHGKR